MGGHNKHLPRTIKVSPLDDLVWGVQELAEELPEFTPQQILDGLYSAARARLEQHDHD